MIIIEDYVREDGVLLKRVYSDSNKYIRKKSTGQVYSEAINSNISKDMYEEIAKEIEVYEENYEVSEQY